MSVTDLSQHSFVNITVVPLDVRLVDDGVEYAEAPERQIDGTPAQVCQLCWQPLDAFALKTPCPGVKVPDTLEGLIT